MSPEEARQKIADLGLDYSKHEFASRVAEGDRQAVKLFLKTGMSANFTIRREEMTPLSLSASAHETEIMRDLLSGGADPNWHQGEGPRPLEAAAMADNAEGAKVLIDAGAEVDPEGTLLEGPMEYAALSGSLDVLRVFREEEPEGKCVMALFMAVQEEQEEAARYLAGEGCPKTLALKHARRVGASDMVSLLQE